MLFAAHLISHISSSNFAVDSILVVSLVWLFCCAFLNSGVDHSFILHFVVFSGEKYNFEAIESQVGIQRLIKCAKETEKSSWLSK